MQVMCAGTASFAGWNVARALNAGPFPCQDVRQSVQANKDIAPYAQHRRPFPFMLFVLWIVAESAYAPSVEITCGGTLHVKLSLPRRAQDRVHPPSFQIRPFLERGAFNALQQERGIRLWAIQLGLFTRCPVDSAILLLRTGD